MKNNSNDPIMVSICCTVYNHEKYLRKCLDGFVMQKTNFKYEILIHDDASTDSSANIIREYEKKYPDIIKPIYQSENQYSQGIKISWTYQYPRVKGKYIALCEGDDYWSDNHKLQKQFNALEKHSDCVFCTHRVRFIADSGEIINQSLPTSINHTVILKKDEWVKGCLSSNYLFQTSSYFFKSKIVKKYIYEIPEFIKAAIVGDTPLMLLSADIGNCIYLEDEMSCYRINSDSSWTRSMQNVNQRRKHVQKGIEYLSIYNQFSDYIYDKYINFYVQMTKINFEFSSNNFKAIFSKEYCDYVSAMPIKQRIKYSLYAILPFTRILHLKVHKICNKLCNEKRYV